MIPFEMPHNTIYSNHIINHFCSCNSCNLSLNDIHESINLDYDSNGHFDECYCGKKMSLTTPHNIGYSQYSTSYHIASCSDCDYYYLEQHTFVNMYPYALPPVIAQGCNKCGFIKM